MKRLVLLAIAGFIIGKIFVSALVSLSQSGSKHSRPHLNFDKSLDEYRHLGPIPDSPDAVLPPVQVPRPVAHQYDPHAAGVETGIPRPVLAEAAKEKPADDTPKDEEKKRRKKRKKKLEKETAPPERAPAPQVVQAPPAVSAPAPQTFGGPIDPNSVPVPPGNPVNNPVYNFVNKPSPVNIATWQDALVHRPTQALIRAFIVMWQKKQITDAQFFQVLAAMQKSPLLPSRQYAVQSAQIQQRYESYVILADEAQTEIDPTVKAMAVGSVKTYENVNELPVLSETLSGGDLVAKTQAAESLKVVIQAFSNNRNLGLAQALFGPFVPILTAITKEQVPPDLLLNAQSDLQQIDLLLGIASN